MITAMKNPQNSAMTNNIMLFTLNRSLLVALPTDEFVLFLFVLLTFFTVELSFESEPWDCESEDEPPFPESEPW